MKDKIYIHYGHTDFDINNFNEIKNTTYMTKLLGGLWASETGDKFSWKDWCKIENFRECNEDNSFKFKLKEGSKVLEINSIDNLENLPHIKLEICIPNRHILDFEQLLKDGIDAIKYNLSNDGRLYFALYGWDCDSILVMNKNCIEII